jgi:hypothetical protein
MIAMRESGSTAGESAVGIVSARLIAAAIAMRSGGSAYVVSSSGSRAA